MTEEESCRAETGGRWRAVTPRSRGFTLIEMVVVLTILSLAAAIVLPRLSVNESGRLRSSARSVASLLRYLGERGATTGAIFRLHLSPRDNTVSVTTRMPGGEEKRPEDTFLQRSFLQDGITIADVDLPRLGKITDGEVSVDIGPGGLGEFLMLHLKGKGDQYMTIAAYPQGGRVKVLDGYQEKMP